MKCAPSGSIDHPRNTSLAFNTNRTNRDLVSNENSIDSRMFDLTVFSNAVIGFVVLKLQMHAPQR